MSKTLLEKLFWNPNYFTIAIRKKKDKTDSLFNTHTFHSDLEFNSTPNYWVADPMLVQDKEKTYLFYEACHNGKGIIEVVQVMDDGSVSTPHKVLEMEYHLSYPFVFRMDDNWYMIPESCACNKVQLFKAVDFPEKWEYKQTLLNEYAVDTTVTKVNERYLFTTFIANKQNESVTPKAFWMKFSNDIASLEQIRWDNYNEYNVRGAGGFYIENGEIIRPAQINQANSYGDGIVLKKMSVSENIISETDIMRVSSKNIHFSSYKFDGLHTYTCTDDYEAIDVRCSFFDIFKPIKKLRSVLFGI